MLNLKKMKEGLLNKSYSFNEQELETFKSVQDVAINSCDCISKLIRPGFSEIKVAKMLNEYLRDYGVKSYFHEPFCWFGDRAKFASVKETGAFRYKEFMPSARECHDGDIVLLDVAPILNGYMADIGKNYIIGNDSPYLDEYTQGTNFLSTLRITIKELFENKGLSGGDIYKKVDDLILEQGYTSAHKKYPLGVLGHRLHKIPFGDLGSSIKFMRFGIHAYLSLISRGVLPETLRESHIGSLDGLWAIEPHIGTKNIGIKFEEMLYVQGDEVRWLRDKGFYDE